MTASDLASARAYLGKRRRLSRNPESVQAIDAALLCVEMVMLASADTEGHNRRRAFEEAPTTPMHLPGFEATALAMTRLVDLP
jgi:hypothetical protein